MSAQIDDGGPAFPEGGAEWDRDTHAYQLRPLEGGMTLRDYFAAKAMQAICSALQQGIRPNDCLRMAEDAYFIADGMLKARQS